MPSVASLPTSSDFSNAVGLRPRQGSAGEASTAVLKNETRARPKSAAWRERQLIPQQQAVSKVWLMTGIVMGFRWRPDGCAQVFDDPAGV
jgi:hypothetical protein